MREDESATGQPGPAGTRWPAVVLVATVGGLWSLPAIGDAVLEDAKVVKKEGSVTTVALVIEGDFQVAAFPMTDPTRFGCDLEGVVLARPGTLPIDSVTVKRLRMLQYRDRPEPITRLVFDLEQEVRPQIERTADGMVFSFPAADGEILAPPPSADVGHETRVAIAPQPREAPAAVVEPASMNTAERSTPVPSRAEEDSTEQPTAEQQQPPAVTSQYSDTQPSQEQATREQPETTPSEAKAVPESAQQQTLVLLDGTRIATDGPWRLEGRRIIYTSAAGVLSSIRADSVDLEASRAYRETVERPEPEEVASDPVLVLKPGDLSRFDMTSVAEDEEEAEPVGPTVRVRNWQDVAERGQPVEIYGSITNDSRHTASNIVVMVRAYDAENTLLGERRAQVSEQALRRGADSNFFVTLPQVTAYDHIDIEVTAEHR